MTDFDVVKALLETGMAPELPVITILNDDGSIRVDLIPYKEFWSKLQRGGYAEYELMTRVPCQDVNGRWVGAKKKSAMFVKGALLNMYPPLSSLN